jgi:hypothetical protein
MSLDLNLHDLWSQAQSTPGVLDALRALLAAFVFGQLISWVYEVTYRGLSYSRGFSHSIVLTCVCAAIVVQSMGHSLIAGFGLMGVLSMVRFRTTLKAPRDLSFIMAAGTLGVASGIQALAVAAVGAVGFCAVVLYLHVGLLGTRQRFDGVLRFRVPVDADKSLLEGLLDRYCRRCMLLSISEVAQGSLVEHAYQIKLWRIRSRESLLTDLREQLAVTDARLLMQEATMEY